MNNEDFDEEKMLKEEYAEFHKAYKKQRSSIISGFICGLCTGILLAKLLGCFIF